MADPEAMAKLRAVLDYVPEEAARLLPGDRQDYYDALTRRLHRTVAVKSLVKRRVTVTRPDPSEVEEPSAPEWAPPLPSELPPPVPAMAEAETVVEAREPADAPETAGAEEDFFDVTGKARDLAPVEPDISLSESEWSRLESRNAEPPAEVADAPSVAGEEEDAFEQIVVTPEAVPELPEQAPQIGQRLGQPRRSGAPPLARETGVAEGELEGPAEFEVEEAGEVSSPEEFEVLEEEEGLVQEGQEPPYQINEFTLFRKDTRNKSGRVKSSYFFSTEPEVAGAQPSSLPEDYEVILNEATGIPVIRKSQARVLPVIEIEGLGPVMAERLERAGVRTTRDLLRIDPRTVSSDTGISERLLANFRAMADLLQLPGVYPDQAAAMVYAGVRSLSDLKSASPAELAKRVNDTAKDHQLKLRGKMTASRIKSWQQKLSKLLPE